MHRHIQTDIEHTIGRTLQPEECQLLESFFEARHYPAHAFLRQAGNVCKNAFFIVKGSCYSYTTDQDGKRHAVRFAVEGMWLADLYSLFTDTVSRLTLETLEPTDVIVFSRDNIDRSFEVTTFMDRYFRILAQNAYIALQARMIRSQEASAEERYQRFVDDQPELVQRIPQYLIASYLGIQPETLSRIRQKNKKA
jgi:CRP-like cAMP-binding protein